MWFLAIWFFLSYVSAICVMFFDFDFDDYGNFGVIPQEKYKYDAKELLTRWGLSFIPVLNIVFICLFIYVSIKPIKKCILRSIKKMLEEVDNDE